MNDQRRRELRRASGLIADAKGIIDHMLTEEPDADAISWLEDAAEKLDLADDDITEAIGVGHTRKAK